MVSGHLRCGMVVDEKYNDASVSFRKGYFMFCAYGQARRRAKLSDIQCGSKATLSQRYLQLVTWLVLTASLSISTNCHDANAGSAMGANLAINPKPYIEITDYCSLTQIATDITTCGQAAIDAASASVRSSYGGSTVHFPGYLSPYNLMGTLALNASFVSLLGDGPQASYINCANGSSDCIAIGTPATPTRGQKIEGLAINGNGAKTNGANINIRNTFNVLIERVQVDNCITCFDIGPNNNSVTLRDVIAIANQRQSDYGVYWHASGDGSSRNDVLTLNNVVITGEWSNATGLMWEGFANTLVATHLRILHSKYGMRVTNPAASKSFYPSFLNAFDLELEGFKIRALSIEGGTDFKITGSDINNLSGGAAGQANADDVAVSILADDGASNTRGVSIANTRIGGSRSSGIWSDSRDLQLSNVAFYTTSYAGRGFAPVIHLGAESSDAILDNIICEEFGGTARSSYCVQIDAGAKDILISNVNAHYVHTGVINDLGGTGVSILNTIEPHGLVTSKSVPFAR
jgi:hypothetical protein